MLNRSALNTSGFIIKLAKIELSFIYAFASITGRSSTVDTIRNLLPRNHRPLTKDSGWMGDRSSRLISTRARVDHVANDH